MMHLTRLGEVADHGYAWEADHYCDSCIGHPVPVDACYIGSHEEADSPMHCCCCGSLIPGTLTDEGVAHVRKAWAKNPKGDVEQLWHEEFAWAFPYDDEPEFNRFDVCEAWCQYAHDYGAYEIITRLGRMHFKPRPSLSLGSLNANAYAIYRQLATRAR